MFNIISIGIIIIPLNSVYYSAGEHITLRVNAVSAGEFESHVEIELPGGIVDAARWDDFNDYGADIRQVRFIDYELKESGHYTIYVSEHDGAYTSTYWLNLQCREHQRENAEFIEYDTYFFDTISPLGDVDAYRFYGKLRETILLDILAINNGEFESHVEIELPGGIIDTVQWDDYNTYGNDIEHVLFSEYELKDSGIYTVYISEHDGAHTDTYSLELKCLQNTYDVTFYVSDGSSPLSGIGINIPFYGTATTDEEGVVTFAGIMPQDSLLYQVSSDIYYYKEGYVHVTDTDVKVDIELELNAELNNVFLLMENTIFLSTDTIWINGTVSDNNGALLPDKTVLIVIEKQGIHRIYEISTKSNGIFTFPYIPLKDEYGDYVVSASVKDEVTTTDLKEFHVLGAKLKVNGYVIWDVEVGDTLSGSIPIQNLSMGNLTNIHIEILSKPDNSVLIFDTLSVLKGSNEGFINFKVTGNDQSEGYDYHEIKLRFSSAEGVSFDFKAWFYSQLSGANLIVDPNVINTTIIKDTSKLITVKLTNTGAEETGMISVAMPNSDYISLITPEVFGPLGSDEFALLIFRINSENDMPLNVPFSGNIAINSENSKGIHIPYSIEAVSESTGELIVDVMDEYTFYTDDAPHLSDAHVVLRHPYTGEMVAEGYTDENGLYNNNLLNEGYYSVLVEAPKHETYNGFVNITAGRTETLDVIISYQAISYSWIVTPASIQDEYSITLEMDYETNVPVPVVEMIVPDIIPSLEPDEEYMFYITLTNHGLISAQNVLTTIQPDDGYEFYGLPDKMEIPAKHSVTFPVVTRRIQSSAQPALLKSAAADQPLPENCSPVTYTYYEWECGPDFKWHQTGEPIEREGVVCEIDYDDIVIGYNQPPGSSGSAGIPNRPRRVPGTPSSASPSSGNPVPYIQVIDFCIPCLSQFAMTAAGCLPILGELLGPYNCIISLTDDDISLEDIIDCLVTISPLTAKYKCIYGMVRTAFECYGHLLPDDLLDLLDNLNPSINYGKKGTVIPYAKSNNIPDELRTAIYDMANIANILNRYDEWLTEFMGDSTCSLQETNNPLSIIYGYSGVGE